MDSLTIFYIEKKNKKKKKTKGHRDVEEKKRLGENATFSKISCDESIIRQRKS